MLFLPVAYTELKIIGMVQSFVNGNVAANNIRFKLSEDQRETALLIGNIIDSKFYKYTAHTRMEQDKKTANRL